MLRWTSGGVVLVAALVTLGGLSDAVAEEVPTLREEIQDQHAIGADGWIYNDIERGFTEAKRTGKPLFVTFRCVPCKDCEGFDAEVAKGSELIRELAGEHFIAVRQIEMKGVDLSQFQFDHDLNWAAMFLNADGTVYARYGTQSAAGADAYNSVEGLSATMRRVLKLHENYPANKVELAGKRGADKPYATALEMPGLANREKLAAATTRNNCIHCHMIHDAEQNAAYEAGTFDQNLLWRYPLPENIGLMMNPQSGVRVMRVVAESAAAGAGLKQGDEITHVEGQAITSIADIQWALHGLPNDDTTVTVTTANGSYDLALPAGWKQTDISWRGSLWSLHPVLPVWMEPASDEQRRNAPVGDDDVPLLVKWINRGRSGGQAAFDAGLREGDLVVACDGQLLRFAKSPAFIMHVKLNYKVGDELPLTVVGQNGRRRDVTVKLVE